MTKSTEYLYDTEATTFSDLPYTVALQYKVKKAKELLDRLLEEDFKQRDDDRILAVHRAIKFNEALLEELSN
jgi:type III secretory pathway component EscV